MTTELPELPGLDIKGEFGDANLIHTCSYQCERPACIRAQRDELVSRLAERDAGAVDAHGFLRVPVRLSAEQVSAVKDMLGREYRLYDMKARPLWANLLEIVVGLPIYEQEDINADREEAARLAASATPSRTDHTCDFTDGLDDCKACTPSRTDPPDLTMCPAGCGCLWRDNGDGTMSLFGPNSRSCSVCEPLAWDRLVPLHREPRGWDAQAYADASAAAVEWQRRALDAEENLRRYVEGDNPTFMGEPVLRTDSGASPIGGYQPMPARARYATPPGPDVPSRTDPFDPNEPGNAALLAAYAPARTKRTYDAVVRVCPECDIADCRHIRKASRTDPPAPAVEREAETEREIAALLSHFADIPPAWVQQHVAWLRSRAAPPAEAREPVVRDDLCGRVFGYQWADAALSVREQMRKRLADALAQPRDTPRTDPPADGRGAVAWQTMDTAPRDGTVVMLRWGQDGEAPGWYLKRKEFANGRRYAWAFIDGGSNGRPFINHAVDTEYGPTHWAPYTRAGYTIRSGDMCRHGKWASEPCNDCDAVRVLTTPPPQPTQPEGVAEDDPRFDSDVCDVLIGGGYVERMRDLAAETADDVIRDLLEDLNPILAQRAARTHPATSGTGDTP